MRAYDRTSFKRGTRDETSASLAESGGEVSRRRVPEHWSRFTRILEDAASERPKAERRSILRMTRCGRLDLERTFRCGGSEAVVDAWCGREYCEPCADRRAAGAARFAREEWDERVFVVDVSFAADDRLELPSPAAVASVRAAWGSITKQAADLSLFSRLEPVPRTVISPEGVTFFSRLPWEPGSSSGCQRAAEQTLALAVRRAARAVGLSGVRPRGLSREAAAVRLRELLTQERDRFSRRVAQDVTRLAGLGWRSQYPGDASLEAALRAMSRRWLEQLRARQRSRRQTILGSKTSLPAPPPVQPTFRSGTCPEHGAVCAVEATQILDHSLGQVIQRFPDEALSGATSRHAVAAFLERAVSAPPELTLELPVRLAA